MNRSWKYQWLTNTGTSHEDNVWTGPRTRSLKFSGSIGPRNPFRGLVFDFPRGKLRCCFHFPRSNKANSHFLHSVVWRVCVFVYIRHQTELVSFTQSLHYKKKAQSVKLSWMNNDSRVESFGTVPFWSHWQTTVAMRDYWNIAFCQLSQISVPQQKN